jgi:hypothetical protein
LQPAVEPESEALAEQHQKAMLRAFGCFQAGAKVKTEGAVIDTKEPPVLEAVLLVWKVQDLQMLNFIIFIFFFVRLFPLPFLLVEIFGKVLLRGGLVFFLDRLEPLEDPGLCAEAAVLVAAGIEFAKVKELNFTAKTPYRLLGFFHA